MRNLAAIDHLQGGARGRVGSWCSAMSAALALVLALAPVTASAGAPSPDAVPPSPDAVAPTEQPETVLPTKEPAADPPAAEPGAEPEMFQPVDIPAPPPPEPAPPLPEPVPPPEAAPPPEPVPPVEGPSAEQRTSIQTQRKAGLGVMGVAGGVLTAVGLGMTLTFTILGDAAQSVDEPVTKDVEHNDSLARVGGILIASGAALAAAGGIVFTNAERKANGGSVARVRVVPAIGGVVLSGRF